MIKLTIDPQLRRRLHNLDSRIELCDEAGQTLGFFVPASEELKLLYAWARDEFKEEEIEASRKDPGGHSLGGVLAELHDA